MGGFYICRDDDGADDRLATARDQFDRHGFSAQTPLSWPGYRGFHVGYIHGGPALLVTRGDDFIAVAGTIAYDGLVGLPALERLLDDAALPLADWDKLTGQFAMLIRKGGRTFALTDYFGAFQLFHDRRYGVVSTSFLATAKSLPQLSLDAQGVYEFAFNVFPTGEDTVLAEVRRLGPDEQVELGERHISHPVAKPLPEHISDAPVEALIASHAAALRAAFAPFVAAYGDRIQCPLSGGLDSRLALALLRDAGVRPHVYVYGQDGDEDVEIARAIGAAEGFEVELFDKAGWRDVRPAEFGAVVERNFHETDALVTDGGLFDNGGNAHARHARQAGGGLAVSGGCGEVFRNFFYMPNRRLRARDVVRAFYSRYARTDTTRRFDPARFTDAIAAKAAHSLGRADPDEPLPRQVIEQLYPRMRSRAFFGREISLVARHGGYLMPFFDAHVVAEAVQLPMNLKNYGRFEAQLLDHIDPVLARHMSAYGHSFAEPPSRGHRFEEIGTRMRPVWARQHSYAMRRALGPTADEHGGLLGPSYLGRVMDLHFPAMRRFFNVRRIADTGLYRRVATLEYLAQHLGDRLIGEFD